jgi:hypothetical protein
MSEYVAETTDGTPADIDIDWTAPDALLLAIVGVAANASREGRGFQVPVTLWVRGSVVCGDLVGREAWMTELLEAQGEEGNPIAKAFSDNWARENAEPDAADQVHTMLHLLNAKVYGVPDAPVPAGQGFFWRGRSASVDAWSFGTLTPPSEDA